MHVSSVARKVCTMRPTVDDLEHLWNAQRNARIHAMSLRGHSDVQSANGSHGGRPIVHEVSWNHTRSVRRSAVRKSAAMTSGERSDKYRKRNPRRTVYHQKRRTSRFWWESVANVLQRVNAEAREKGFTAVRRYRGNMRCTFPVPTTKGYTWVRGLLKIRPQIFNPVTNDVCLCSIARKPKGCKSYDLSQLENGPSSSVDPRIRRKLSMTSQEHLNKWLVPVHKTLLFRA